MRPIDADVLMRDIEQYHLSDGKFQHWVEVQPTVDAVPVRHGKWIDMDEQSYTWKVRCSVCGHERSMMSTQGEYPNYCENCGARMVEDE